MSKQQPQVLELRLYVAGDAANSARAQSNLAALQRRNPDRRFEVEVVDLLEEPARALPDRVLVTPTLVRLDPGPPVHLAGDLSAIDEVSAALGLGHRERVSGHEPGTIDPGAIADEEIDGRVDPESGEVTLSRQAQAELVRSEARLRQIVDNAREGIWTIDAQGRTTFANPRMEEILGCAPGELVGRNVTEFLDGEGRRQLKRRLARRAKGISETYELRFHRTDGTEVWLRITGNPLQSADGRYIGSMGMVSDVTEERRAREALHRLSQAIEQSPASTVITDTDSRIEYVNPQFVEETGYSPAELIGKTPAVIRSGNTPDEVYQDLYRTIESGKVWRGEIQNRRKNGELFWEVETIAPIRNEAGKIVNYVAVKTNVTKRKEAEEALKRKTRELDRLNASLEERVAERTRELKQAKQEAEAANQAKSVFLASMSHELRTPMNAILGFTRLLQRDGTLPRKHRGYLETINRSGEHLMALLNGLLQMSKIEAGRVTVEYDVLDVFSLCRDIIEIFRPGAEDQGVALELDWDDELPRLIESDPHKLREILHNLVSNAVKFTDQGSVTLRVRRAEDSSMLRFSVIDTGRGIAAAAQERIFHAFEQAGDPSASATGTGLGLAISRNFATLLQGSLHVESSPGRGSTFVLDLPFRATAGEFARTEPVTVTRLEFSDVRPLVLVVDDVEDNRRLLVQLLKEAGLRTIDAASGRAALALIDQERPDAALLDLRMPGMDGFELAAALRRSRGRDMKLVAVSASAYSDVMERALQNGFDAYLPKPVNEEHLITRLGDLLGLNSRTEVARKVEHIDGAAVRAALSRLPDDLREALEDAAAEADTDSLNTLCRKLRHQAPEAAEYLAAMVRNFRYDLIVRALDNRKN